jgi:tRNA A-37 threonylcarbamoyl transferase component Bud32
LGCCSGATRDRNTSTSGVIGMPLLPAFFKPRTASLPTGGRDEFALPSQFAPEQHVKKNRQRTVYRFERDGQRYYVKTCRIDGIRAWFRDLFRGPKARLEFEKAMELAARKISAVEPVFWIGRTWPGESTIVTREVSNAIPLADYLTQQFPQLPSDHQRLIRRKLARSLGEFLASLYVAGAIHPDPHPGNLLLSFDNRGEAVFTLLDVHAVQFSQSIRPSDIVANLVLFNRWFILRTSRTDRMRYWTAFRLALGQFKREDGRAVEQRTMESNLRFWASRFSRYTGENREFRSVRIGPYRGYAVRDEIPESILQDPDSVFERRDRSILKSSRSSNVISFAGETSCGPRRFVFKRIPVRSWFSPIKNLFRASAIARSWRYGSSLRDRFLPTPRPLVAFHRYQLGLPCEGYILFEELCGAVTLDRAVQGLANRDDRTNILRSWTDRLGRLIRMMHDRGIHHGDLKAANILVQVDETNPHAAEFSLVDLVGTTSSRSITRPDRIVDLARLAASFLKSEVLTNTLRRHFLNVYKRVPPEFPLCWREIVTAVDQKRQRNKKRGRMLE